ncbi:MAG: ankyrin repeat domain-containing protein [Pirellulaceae bacterium]|nr:ankyrin repeat domain-containing protein [Pirellulaceae bacterium]
MIEPHAHPILFKSGYHGLQKDSVAEGQKLLRDVDIDPLFGPEVLVWATGDFETVKKMLSQHPELLHVGYLEPWLHETAKKGQIEVATWLLDSGGDINAIGGTFRGNVLHWAMYYKQPKFVKFLLENGAKFDTRCIYSNPIITAIEDGNLDLVRLFLKFGIDPNVMYTIEDGDLRNAMSYAEDLEHTAIVADWSMFDWIQTFGDSQYSNKLIV